MSLNEVREDTENAVSFPLKTYVANLGLIVFAGTLGLIWVWYYTDTLPVVGGLLGLGGVLAWGAFILNVLSDERKKHLQARLEHYAFDRIAMAVMAIGILTALGAWAACYGTLELSSIADDQVRHVTIDGEAAANRAGAGDDQYLLPGSRSKYLVRTSFLGPRKYRIQLSGLPSLTIDARAFRKTVLLVPGSFTSRNTLLIRPQTSLSATLATATTQDAYKLSVSLPNGPADSLIPYSGGIVWVGCDKDVAVPDAIVDQWRNRLLVDEQSPDVASIAISRWMNANALLSRLDLQPGDKIRIAVSQGNGEVIADTQIVILPVSSLVKGCQEVLINEM